MKTVLFLLMAFAFASCGHYSDGTSVWAGGAWLIFWLPFVASFVFLYFAYRASRSNSTTQVDLGTPKARIEDNTGNVPIYKTGQFWFFVVLQVFAWGAVVYQNMEK